MKVIFHLIRLAGYALGLFVLASGVADVLGYVPHSYGTPPWTSRLAAALPAILAGIVFLVPIKKFLNGKRYIVLAMGYALVVIATGIQGFHGLADYLAGTKHWVIVPTVLFLFGIAATNAFVLWYMHRFSARLPNYSSKPTADAAA